MRVICLALALGFSASAQAQESKSYSLPIPSSEIERCLVDVSVMTFTGLAIASDYGTVDPVLEAIFDELDLRYRERCAVAISLFLPKTASVSEQDVATYIKWRRVGQCMLALGTSVPHGQRLTELLEIGPSTIDAWCQGFESAPLPPNAD